jgi:hypothetical protein
VPGISGGGGVGHGQEACVVADDTPAKRVLVLLKWRHVSTACRLQRHEKSKVSAVPLLPVHPPDAPTMHESSFTARTKVSIRLTPEVGRVFPWPETTPYNQYIDFIGLKYA